MAWGGGVLDTAGSCPCGLWARVWDDLVNLYCTARMPVLFTDQEVGYWVREMGRLVDLVAIEAAIPVDSAALELGLAISLLCEDPTLIWGTVAGACPEHTDPSGPA